MHARHVVQDRSRCHQLGTAHDYMDVRFEQVKRSGCQRMSSTMACGDSEACVVQLYMLMWIRIGLWKFAHLKSSSSDREPA